MLEDLSLRLRTVENVESPVQRDLKQKLGRLESRVQRMDVEGTHVTQIRLQNIESDIAEIRDIIKQDRDEKSADRRVTLGAIISALVALGIALVSFVASRGGP
jgi:septal ring factor EnvC (AmiA/AmiB activator)